jgi:putative membrane protein
MKKNIGYGVCMAALLIAVPVPAQETRQGQTEPQQSSSDVAQSKQEFLKGALASNRQDIQIGKLAQERASHPAVRKLGETLAEDHQRIQKKLESIAKDQSAAASGSLDRDDLDRWRSIRNASGREFDQRFLQLVIQERQNDLHRLPQMRAQFASDPEIRRLIDENSPMLIRHREMAEAAYQQVRAAANDPSGTRTASTDRNEFGQSRAERAAERNEEEAESLKDGTIAGVVPAPSRTVRAGSTERYIAAELKDGKVDPNVSNVLQADTRTAIAGGAPASAERSTSQDASNTARTEQRQELPQAAREALTRQGWSQAEGQVRQRTVYEAQVNGRTVLVTEDGKVLRAAGQQRNQ